LYSWTRSEWKCHYNYYNHSLQKDIFPH